MADQQDLQYGRQQGQGPAVLKVVVCPGQEVRASREV